MSIISKVFKSVHEVFLRYFWKRIIPIVFCCFIFFLISCEQISPQGKLLKTAELQMRTAQSKAIDLIGSIPDSLFLQQTVVKGHHSQCMQVARYYKAAKNIDSCKWDEAKHWLQLIISSCKDTTDIQEAFAFYDMLTIASIRDKAVVPNTVKDSLVRSILAKQRPPNHTVDIGMTNTEKSLLHSSLYWPLIIFIIIMISYLLIYQSEQKTDNYIKSYQREISFLGKQTKRQSEKTSHQLGYGKNIYEKIMNGGQLKNISIEQEQNFIDYYALTFPDQYAELIHPYTNLSLRHTTYLILKTMGYADSDIQHILFVKGSTIRNYRLRINKNKKNCP